jgi:hypothetical protein
MRRRSGHPPEPADRPRLDAAGAAEERPRTASGTWRARCRATVVRSSSSMVSGRNSELFLALLHPLQEAPHGAADPPGRSRDRRAGRG